METPENGVIDTWTNYPVGVDDFFSNGWFFSPFGENQLLSSTPNPPFSELEIPTDPGFLFPLYPSSVTSFTIPGLGYSSCDQENGTSPIPIQQFPTMGGEENGLFGSDLHCLEQLGMTGPIVEMGLQTPVNVPEFNSDFCGEDKIIRVKKVEGQPSKNLMAERRRRKRLNDRLLMLRSIVPKVSKMDRTAILGDTIDYMKELLEKVKNLQEQDPTKGSDNLVDFTDNTRQMKANELVRNSPKFDVERRNDEIRIEICCATNPGLLLSTISTLEALGLDIHKCVVSCFSDFSMKVSCSEAVEQQIMIDSGDIKQALCRNAGYGGRSL